MLKTIKARYEHGHIEPLEPLPVAEGVELELTISWDEASAPEADPTLATAGAWKDLLDCELFEADVYQNRLMKTRPDVVL